MIKVKREKMDILPIIKNKNKVGQIIEYRKENGDLHRVIGPAYKMCEDNIWTYQWWDNGVLVAIYSGFTEELFYCVEGNQYELKKLPIRTKWRDYEQSITLSDIKMLIRNYIKK